MPLTRFRCPVAVLRLATGLPLWPQSCSYRSGSDRLSLGDSLAITAWARSVNAQPPLETHSVTTRVALEHRTGLVRYTFRPRSLTAQSPFGPRSVYFRASFAHRLGTAQSPLGPSWPPLGSHSVNTRA